MLLLAADSTGIALVARLVRGARTNSWLKRLPPSLRKLGKSQAERRSGAEKLDLGFQEPVGGAPLSGASLEAEVQSDVEPAQHDR